MSDHYRIGVAILLRDGMSPVLSHISGRLLGIHKSVKDIEGGMNRWKTAIVGAAAVTGGVGLLGALTKVAEKGSAIVHQMEMMKVLGLSNKEIAGATAKAFGVSITTPQTTIAENLKHLTELRYAFGHLDDAKKYLEPVSRSNAILNSVKGGGHDEVWSLVKALEEKGVTTNPAQFASYVDTMTKAVIGSGGRVTPQSFFQAFKYGRTAMLGWDEKFVGATLPRLIQSMSGGGGSGSGTGGPGNALMSAFAKVVQGQMPRKAAEEFKRLGLTTSYSEISGSSKSKADIKGADLFTKNPYEWTQQILMPAMAKAGITSEQAIIQEVSRLMPVRTASQVIAMMALQGRFREGANSPFEKDAAINRQSFGLQDAYGELSKHDPTMVMRAFTQQWTNMLEALGKAGNPMYLGALQSLTSVFQAVTSFSQEHAGVIEVVAKGLAALGAFLAAGGTVAIIAALGPAGWIAGGIAALGAVIAMIPWQTVGTAIAAAGSKIKEGIDAVMSAFSSFASWLGSFLPTIPKGINSGASTKIPPHVGKQGYNAVPPPSGAAGGPTHIGLIVDGRKLAEATVPHMTRDMNGPLRGSAYYDGSSTFIPADFSYARG